MAGRIPREFIDDLLMRVDVVDLVDEQIPLRKAGRDYAACCPFHNEKTPSFTVSRDKQFYHCFGCGAHGTAIDFLMEYHRLGFVEAVAELAQRAGLELPRQVEGEDAGGGPSRQPLYDILEEAAGWYRRQLRTSPAAVDYLKGRGLTGAVAGAYGIGYAPDAWGGLRSALGTDPGRLRALLASGLLIEREDGHTYDRFRNRVMFPIRDRRGRTVGFGGRVLGQGEPKYLNSPETPVFHKGRELYGLFESRRAGGPSDRLVIVEGYMDVVALAQHGIHNAVATLGTATTAEHLARLFRAAPTVCFCFDGDSAGRRAAWRALETCLGLLGEGHEARFAFLPEGEDPDTLVRAGGGAAFTAVLDRARTASALLLDGLSRQVDLGTLDGRARLVELARPYVARLPAGALRELIAQEIATLAQLPASALTTLGERGGERGGQPAPRGGRGPGPPTYRAASPMRRAVSLLLHHPGLAHEIEAVADAAALREIPSPGTPLLLEMLELARRHPNITRRSALEQWRHTESGPTLEKLATAELPDSADFDPGAELRAILQRLLAERQAPRLAELSRRARQGALDEAERDEYLRLSAELAPGRRSPRGP